MKYKNIVDCLNFHRRTKWQLMDGYSLEVFLDGIWLLSPNDRRLEIVSDYCWMNQHMLEAA